MKRNDWLLVGACLLLGAAGLLLARLTAPAPAAEGAALYAQVLVNEQPQALLPLAGDAAYRILSPDGGENVLRVTAGSMRMESANCHNQLCVLQGEVTLANRELRPMGALIVCAPHRVVCQLLTTAQAAELGEVPRTAAVTELEAAP